MSSRSTVSSSVASLLFLSLLGAVSCTTEWWGDLRAHMNPARNPAFYDVTYDDGHCAGGLRSNAIPDYAYFGRLLATQAVDTHDQCLQLCMDKDRCRAVNFFLPMTYLEKGFCELLSETQYDNPRLMRPFRQAVYYENIACRDESPLFVDDQPSPPTSPPAPVVVRKPQRIVANTPKKQSAPSPMIRKGVDKARMMKKLSAKVKEFSKKFSDPFRARRRRA